MSLVVLFFSQQRASWLAPRLRTVTAQRIINLLVGMVMWFIAWQLAQEGYRHIQLLFN